MPKFTLLQNDFSWGALSERTFARIDLEAYRKGVKTLENAYPFQQGGVRRRPGTRFIYELPSGTATESRALPLVFSTALSCLAIFTFNSGGSGEIWFLENGTIALSGGSPYSISHPYTSSQLRAVRYVQVGRALVITHPDHPPKLLVRNGTNSWELKNINFLQLAQAETWFENANVRFRIINGAVPFRTDLGRGFGDRFTATVDATGAITSIVVDMQDPDGDASNNNPGDPGYETIVAPADGTIVFDQTEITTATAQTYTITCVRAEADKTYWTVSGSVSGVADGSPTAAPPFDWGTGNYPFACAWYQQRLWFGGTAKSPTRLFASSLSLYSDFTLGVNDDDAFSFQIASDSFDAIYHLSAARVLLIHTFTNEFSVVGGNQMAVTPTNFLVQPQTAHGSNLLRPFRVGNEILYAQRGSTRLRATSYQVATDAYVAPDISLFAEDLALRGLRQAAFAQDPDFMSWIVMNDGTMTSVTLNRDQNSVGWAHHTFDGTVRDVVALKSDTNTLVYMLIQRTINGSQKMYLERFVYDDYVWSDCSKTYGTPGGTPGSPVSTLTGLSHIEGKTVNVVVDDKLHPNKTVSGGQITLDFPYTTYACVGLPYTSEIELLHPEIGQIVNNIQGDLVSAHEIIIRFKDTVTCKIDYDASGDKEIPFMTLPYVAGSAIPPFTGDKKVHASGWKNPWNLVLKQDRPFSWTILGIIMKLSVNPS